MREIDLQFKLNLLWTDQHNPLDIAKKLKIMELEYTSRVKLLPTKDGLKTQAVGNLALDYWNTMREYL